MALKDANVRAAYTSIATSLNAMAGMVYPGSDDTKFGVTMGP